MVVAGVVVVGGGLVAWQRWSRPLVTVTEPTRGPVVQAFYSTGTVQPEREYPIKSNVAGVLEVVPVDKGARVARGQHLATVAAPELEYAAAKARAELEEKAKRADPSTSPVLTELDARAAAAGAQLEIAQRELDRARAAARSNAAPEADVDRAADRAKALWAELESLKAQRAARVLELDREVAVARATVDTATWDLRQRELHSPIDGVVLDRPASVGTRLAVNDHLMQIADVTPANLVMRAQVDEEDKVQVRPGQVVRMSLYSFPDRVFDGHVGRVYDQADPDRRTFEVDVRFDHPSPDLAAGMTGELAFVQAEKQDAAVIPSQAVQGGVVWVVRDDRLVRTDATIGIRSVERAEVTDGLAPTARVVISPIGALTDGQPVRTQYLDPATAAGLNRPKEASNFKGFN